MFTQLGCILVDSNSANRAEMAEFMSNHGANVIAAIAAVDHLPGLLAGPEQPQIVMVNLDPSPRDVLRKLEPIVRQYPSLNFFVLSQTIDAHLLMDVMHLGIKEFIPLPIQEEKFVQAIERIAQKQGGGKRASFMHFIPTAGGCGSTTLACNVAASLARTGKTVLIDLDLVRGAVASSFDLRPRYTIADVMRSADKLDRQLLDNALAVHAGSNLAVLARPEQPEETQRIGQAGFNRLLGVLGQMFDYVVMDSLMSVEPLYSAAIQAADVNVLVVQLNIPSVKNAERFIAALRRMGIDPGKIRLVVNRYVKRGGDIEPAEVERVLGMKIAWLVPNDFRNVIAAINFGEPLVLRAPRAEISTSLRGLAGMLNGRKVEA